MEGGSRALQREGAWRSPCHCPLLEQGFPKPYMPLLPSGLLQQEITSSCLTRLPLGIWRGSPWTRSQGLSSHLRPPWASPHGAGPFPGVWVILISSHLPKDTFASNSQTSNVHHFALDGKMNKGTEAALLPSRKHFQTFLVHLPMGTSTFSSCF